MCRFLLVRSKAKLKPGKLLNQFASICEENHAPEGDWQGDGWGISIKNEKLSRLSGIHDAVMHKNLQTASGQITKWDIYKSLRPIWEDKDKFQQFGETNSFIVHARSAGFPDQKGLLEYNQPYVSDNLCFVFNGMIKGVKLDRKLEGKIGAQKIFSLIREEQKVKPLDMVLRFTDKLILENSQKIIGMNIGITDGDKFYILCEYENNPSYFGIKYFQDDSITLVCSEPIGSFDWKVMERGEILIL